jgi:hypothetical protein
MRLQDDARRSASGPRATVLQQRLRPTPTPPPFFPGEEPDETVMSKPPEPVAPTRQDKTILRILRTMAMGHLFLGLALALGSVILEAFLHQPLFFGLAASGAILGACGVILRLNLERRVTLQSPLVFYLLPYTDFVNVGLWLLLFGMNGPILLFFAYVILSTALLLGSRQAIALTLIAGGTICAVTLSQKFEQITPTLTLPEAFNLPILLSLTVLALGLIAYAARLFSLNLDRFTHESARQSEDLLHQRLQFSQQQQQLTEELEALNEDLTHYLTGKTQTRVSAFFELLAPLQKNLNAVLEQGEKLLYAAAYANRLQEKITVLKQTLERAYLGDRSALQMLASPSKTALDALSQPLVSISQQWFELQYLFQRARAEYQSMTSLTADLAMLRQSLNSADAALSEMLARSTQGARHLHALFETDGTTRQHTSGSLNNERPLLREMELRANQQSSGLELLRARLKVLSERLEYVEQALRKVGEGLEQALKIPSPSRPMPRAPEQPDFSEPKRQPRATSPLTLPAHPAPARHFSGPLTPPGPLPDPDGPRLVH